MRQNYLLKSACSLENNTHKYFRLLILFDSTHLFLLYFFFFKLQICICVMFWTHGRAFKETELKQICHPVIYSQSWESHIVGSIINQYHEADTACNL